jgi:murein DD-endopeptidase MepM/ murein hydrolase activator NlpD
VATAATLAVLVKADGINRLQKQLVGVHGDLEKTAGRSRHAGDELEKTGKRGSRALAGLKVAGGALAGLAAFDIVSKSARAMVDEFQEARKVSAQTGAVLKSTGGAANVSAKQIADLAGALSRKAGIDDEAIQSGENLLLTFTRVRNETGKGNDVFNQATKAALDMSVAMGTDMRTSALQLGKALNDPAKGLGKLQRSGVTFTEQQKKQIEALQAQGKTLEAQKIIIAEVNKEFGGSAAAAATPLDHLKVSLGNLAETAGAVLVPALDVAARALTGMLTAASATGAVIGSIIGWFKEHETVTLALAAAVGVLGAALITLRVVALAQMIPTLAGAATAWLALNAAMLLSPAVLIAAGLAALAAALVVAYRESETFRKIVDAAFRVVGATASWLAGAIKTTFDVIVTVVRTSWAIIRDSTTTIWNGIRSFLSNTWSWLRGAASDTWNAIRAVITGAMTAARDTLTGIWGAIRSVAAGAWQGIRDSAVMWWGLVQGAIVTPIRAARDAVSEVWTQIRSRASEAWEGLKNAAGDFATGMKDRITGAFKDAANLVIGFINKIIDAINILPGVPNIKKLAELAEGGVHGGRATQGFARGGAFARTGGLITSPMTLMGEEAPRHREWVIPENPAYRKRAQMLVGQAAQAVGFAEGGVYSKDELAALWRRANGNLGNANLMAAIALAESNGNPNAYNPSGATGLWQILGNPFPGNARDPLTNARMAGAKLRTQGLGAWEAYTNGAYRKYLSGSGGVLGKIGDVIGAVGGVLGDLLSQGADFILDKLPGVGSLPDWIQGLGKHVLGGVTGWVKDKVAGLIGLGGGQDGGMSATGGKLQLPATFASTHQTAGLPGYPAIDVFAKPGTTVLSPIDGVVSRLAGQSPARGAYMGPGGPFGWSMYLQGGGRSYFLTHFGARSVRAGQQVQRGQAIGLVGDYPGSVPDHIHEGVSGMAKGGIFGGAPFVGSYATGGVVPQDGFAYVHQGETINARGNGALVHIDQMVVNDSFDEEVWARKLALRLDQSAY